MEPDSCGHHPLSLYEKWDLMGWIFCKTPAFVLHFLGELDLFMCQKMCDLPAGLKTESSFLCASLFPPALCVLLFVSLPCFFTLFVYSFSIFSFQLSFSLVLFPALPLSGKKQTLSPGLFVLSVFLFFHWTNRKCFKLCVCFRLTFLSFSLNDQSLVFPGLFLSFSFSSSCAGLVDVSLMVLFDSPVMRVMFCVCIADKRLSFSVTLFVCVCVLPSSLFYVCVSVL